MNKNLNGMTKYNRILNRFALMNTAMFNQWITLSNILYHWTHTTRHKEKEKKLNTSRIIMTITTFTDRWSTPFFSSLFFFLRASDKAKSTSVIFSAYIYIWGYYFERTNSLSLSLFFLLVSIRTHVKTTPRYVCVTYRWTNEEK
jgi:hypothetical protein